MLVKGFVHEVVICAGSEVIARHPRSYEREDMIFNPLHYLALLEQKTNALDQAAPLVGWKMPEGFDELRRLMEARLGKKGKRECIQVLRLLETFALAEVAAGYRRCPADGDDLVRCRQAPAAVPHRAAAGTAGSGELSAPASGAGGDHRRRRLSGLLTQEAGALTWTRPKFYSIII